MFPSFSLLSWCKNENVHFSTDYQKDRTIYKQLGRGKMVWNYSQNPGLWILSWFLNLNLDSAFQGGRLWKNLWIWSSCRRKSFLFLFDIHVTLGLQKIFEQSRFKHHSNTWAKIWLVTNFGVDQRLRKCAPGNFRSRSNPSYQPLSPWT